MKTIPKTNTRRQLTTLTLNLGLFAGISAIPLHAQNDETIPVGYSEEEWYDPSDWFDGDNIQRDDTDWSDDDGWSDSADGADGAYGNDGTNRSSNQTRSNQGQNRNGSQTAWNQQDRNQQANRMNQDRSMKKASLTGEVDGFKNVSLKDSEGKRDEQTFVRVRLDNDDSRVVSLGSRLILTDLGLETGDRISVSGRNARIANRKVLVASTIEVDDSLFKIREDNRPDTAQNRSNAKHKRMDSGKNVSINGTVKQSSKTSLSDDMREENLLVRLELKDGRSCVVDLGQNTSFSDLDIEKDSEIRVKGRKTKVDGKSLIVARKISVDGGSTRLCGKCRDGESTSGDRKESREYSDSAESRYDSPEPFSQN